MREREGRPADKQRIINFYSWDAIVFILRRRPRLRNRRIRKSTYGCERYDLNRFQSLVTVRPTPRISYARTDIVLIASAPLLLRRTLGLHIVAALSRPVGRSLEARSLARRRFHDMRADYERSWDHSHCVRRPLRTCASPSVDRSVGQPDASFRGKSTSEDIAGGPRGTHPVPLSLRKEGKRR